MYIKLILRNLKKNYKNYVSYFLTLLISSSMFYGFLSLSSSQYTLNISPQFDLTNMYSFLKYGTIFISLIITFLINYVSNYIFKIRSKEFGIYLLLGMDRGHISISYFIEQIIFSCISVILGIILGVFTSNLLSISILNFMNQNIELNFNLFIDTACLTLIFFLVIFILVNIKFFFKINKLELKKLLLLKKENIIPFVSKKKLVLYSIISIILYIFAIYQVFYYLNIKNLVDISIEYKNFILFSIIISLLFGVMLSFNLISLVLYKLKDKFIYKVNHYIIIIGNYLSRLKQNTNLIFITTIILVASLSCFIISDIMADWAIGFAESKSTFSIVAITRYNEITEPQNIPKINGNNINQYIKEIGMTVQEDINLKFYFQDKEDFLYSKKGRVSSSMPYNNRL